MVPLGVLRQHLDMALLVGSGQAVVVLRNLPDGVVNLLNLGVAGGLLQLEDLTHVRLEGLLALHEHLPQAVVQLGQLLSVAFGLEPHEVDVTLYFVPAGDQFLGHGGRLGQLRLQEGSVLLTRLCHCDDFVVFVFVRQDTVDA